MPVKTKYGIFNKLPPNTRLKDVPEKVRWMFSDPIYTDFSLSYIERKLDEINRDRVPTSIVGMAVIRTMRVVEGPWRDLPRTDPKQIETSRGE